jgi:hypothetical protein
MKHKLYDWILIHKDKHLTIKDLSKMEIGKEYDVVIFDRNFDEPIWDGKEEFKLYTPEEMFEDSHHKIIYRGNLEWDIVFCFGETFRHPVHLDVSHLPTNWTWMAIDNEHIEIKNEIIKEGAEMPFDRPTKMHWEWFRDDTRIGWRGPIMLWEDLKDLPQVYYISPLRLNT